MSTSHAPLFDAWLWSLPEEFRTLRFSALPAGSPPPGNVGERLGAGLDHAAVEHVLRALHDRVRGADLVVEPFDGRPLGPAVLPGPTTLGD